MCIALNNYLVITRTTLQWGLLLKCFLSDFCLSFFTIRC